MHTSERSLSVSGCSAISDEPTAIASLKPSQALSDIINIQMVRWVFPLILCCFHHELTSLDILARPCDRDGDFLPDGVLPEDDDEDPGNEDWESFADRPSFELCELPIEKMHPSVGDINWLLRIIQAKSNPGSGDDGIFANVYEMYAAVDGIDVEGAGWRSFRVRCVYI